jgi:prepilin-type N-terminal cleavage/methylation domain-containing protein
MLNNIKQRKEDGFTIIEVLIVLAIAGLIMVVVFLAVPALQRNSRNNTRKTDANNIMAAVSELTGNKGGAVPVSADLATIKSNVKLGSYSAANVTLVSVTTTAPTKDQVFILPDFTCGATPVDTPVGQTRSTAVWFAVEAGSGVQTQCVAS